MQYNTLLGIAASDYRAIHTFTSVTDILSIYTQIFTHSNETVCSIGIDDADKPKELTNSRW